MTRLRPCVAMLVVTVVAMVSSGQDRSPWHGRIFGITDSNGNNGRSRSLTYTDLENISQRGTLSTDSEMIYALDSISATVYISRQKFINSGESTRSLEIIKLNEMRANRTVEYPHVCTACPECRGCRDETQIATSVDGRYVFTLTARFHEHHVKPPPGQFANDDDASYTEPIVVIYDTASARFLEEPASLPLGGWLVSSSEPDAFEIVNTYDRGLRLIRFRIGGREIPKGVVVSELPVSENQLVRLIRDPANARTLLLTAGGNVIEAAAGHLKQIGAIGLLPAGRQMFAPVVSGDGKLMFVPTGPLRAASVKFAPAAYIDEIDVYNAASLALIRSLHSQRPLLEIVPSTNGDRLFAAIPDRLSIVVLDSVSLWQEEEHLTQSPIHHIAFLP